MSRNLLLITQLTGVFVTAFALSTFLHELAHALTAMLLGVDCRLFHTYVAYDPQNVPGSSQLVIAAAGPLFSLIQASVAFLVIRHCRSALVKLLWLWLGIVGGMVFLGYVVMGPFVDYGDSGKVYRLLGVPDLIGIVFSLAALFAISVMFRKVTVPLRESISAIRAGSAQPVPALALLLYPPLLLGTLFNVLLSLPAPTVLSLAFPLCILPAMIPSAIRIAREPDAGESTSAAEGLAWWPLVAMLLLLAVSRWLATGIAM